jgi:hypothetical protein
MNILGEPFDDYVKTQIEVRQEALGKYGNISEKDLLSFTTKAPFLKLMSSVNLTNRGSDNNELSSSVLKKLVASGINENDISGEKLAKSCILQGGTINSSSSMPEAGLSNGGLNGAYGWGGISERGYVPLPGITNANITYYNNGALSKTVINIKCFSKKQFSLIDVLYMRPGYTLLLEFGHSVYLNNNKELTSADTNLSLPASGFLNGTKTVAQISSLISDHRRTTNGNYEAILGRVTKFNWQFNPDGSYDCQIQLTAVGDVFESLKSNISFSGELSKEAASVKKQTEEYQNIRKKDSSKIIPGKQFAPVLVANAAKSLLDNFLFNEYQRILDGYASLGGKGFKKKQVGFSDSTLFNFNDNISSDDQVVFKGALFFLTNSRGDAGLDQNPRVYMKFGFLLAWVQRNLFLYDEYGIPDLEFDMNFRDLPNDDNFILNIPGQISTEPQKLLIPYRNFSFKDESGGVIGYKNTLINTNLSEEQCGFYNNVKSQYLGRIANVYIATQEISNILSSMKPDENGNIKLLDFLGNITDMMIESMGSINKFRFKISQDGLKIKIIEDIPQRFDEEKTGFTKLIAYGVKPGIEGSFVRDVSLTADLSNDFATMISIGAQANGNQVSADATSFSNYNAGLIDRVTPVKVSSPDLESFAAGSNATIPKKKQVANILVAMAPIFNSMYDTSVYNKEEIDAYKNNMSEAISLALGILTNSNSEGEPQLPAPFFLPFNLKLTMDGISGPKLYQKFKINDEILPPSYEKDGVGLQLTGLNHNIDVAGWTTEFETLSVPESRALGPIQAPPPLEDNTPVYIAGESGGFPQPPEGNETLQEIYENYAKLRIRLTRIYGFNRQVPPETYGNGQTLGIMEVFAEDETTVLATFATVELPWLGNQNNISCVPSGNYLVRNNYRRPKGEPKANNNKAFRLEGNEAGNFAANQIYGNGYIRKHVLIHEAPVAQNWLAGCIAPSFKFNSGNILQPGNTSKENTGTGGGWLQPSLQETTAANAQLISLLHKPTNTAYTDAFFKMEIVNLGGVPDGGLPSLFGSPTNPQTPYNLALSKGLI